MKLAIDCRFWGKSGIGTFTENIVDELILHHPEHDYLLIAHQKNLLYASSSNVTYVLTDTHPFSLKELFLFPVKEINQCDAFFSPYINIPGRIRVPICSTIHDVIFLDVPGLVSNWGLMIRRIFLRRAILHSRIIFTVSEFSRERIFFHFPYVKRVEIIKNCISNNIWQFDTTNVRKQDYFIFVGNIKAHKGLLTLLQAFVRAQQDGLQSNLLIVGSADRFRTSDREIASFLRHVKNVAFTGWVDNGRLCELIAAAKALVLPSKYEGFGIPPMEALCLGTNAIVSDIPVFKEIYSDLPVTFFKVDDADDLCHKLIQPCIGIDTQIVRDVIDKNYNIKHEVNKLLLCLTKKHI